MKEGITSRSTVSEPAGGYDPVHFASLVSVEDRHFWFRVRNDVIAALTAQELAHAPPGYRVLEIGCGDGNVLRVLERVCASGLVVGMDLYREGLRYAQTRVHCPLIQGDVTSSPLKGSFRLIGIFDVLEHVPDDAHLLREIWKLLSEDGALLITVPAHTRLWSYFDEVSGHCRRYEPEELRIRLEDAGYHIEFLTPYMAALKPLMWLNRRIQSKAKRRLSAEEALKEEVRIVPVVNGALVTVLSLETKRLAKRKPLPFGSSLLAIAKKHAPRG